MTTVQKNNNITMKQVLYNFLHEFIKIKVNI